MVLSLEEEEGGEGREERAGEGERRREEGRRLEGGPREGGLWEGVRSAEFEGRGRDVDRPGVLERCL